MLRLTRNADRTVDTWRDKGVSEEDAFGVGLISYKIQSRMPWRCFMVGMLELWHSPWGRLGKEVSINP